MKNLVEIFIENGDITKVVGAPADVVFKVHVSGKLSIEAHAAHDCDDFIKKRHSSATCGVCARDFGWYCPDSKNHICVYTDSYDSCDFCGQPEERK